MTSKYKIQTPRMIWQNCKEGVHSLCQNKNAHSLGLKSHLKRLQFHTMFDVCMTVSWIECLFLHKPSTPARDTSFQQIQFILFILMI